MSDIADCTLQTARSSSPYMDIRAAQNGCAFKTPDENAGDPLKAVEAFCFQVVCASVLPSVQDLH